MLDVGIFTAEQVEAARIGVLESLHTAIEKGRRDYKNQSCFKRTFRDKYYTSWGFKDYPAYLEFPPVEVAPHLTQVSATLPLAA
ncbi:hypothetical protein D3C76_960670 [compost metagenome]